MYTIGLMLQEFEHSDVLSDRELICKKIGLNLSDSEVYLPAKSYRFGNEKMVTNFSLQGQVLCINSLFGCEPLFGVATEELINNLSEQTKIDKNKLSSISKTSALIDTEKGIRDRTFLLQPEILLWEIAKENFTETEDDPNLFGQNLETHVIKFDDFWRKNSKLLDTLGINHTAAMNITCALMGLEKSLEAGKLGKVERILQLDPHLATVYFGHKTAEILAGFEPSDQQLATYQMFISRKLEIAPVEIDMTDFIEKSEWANTLNLFRDAIFERAYPLAFELSNEIAGKKTGFDDPLVRQFYLMNYYDVSSLGLNSLTDFCNDPHVWVEKRPKGLLSGCLKALEEYKKELTQISSFDPSETQLQSSLLECLEMLLSHENPSIEEAKLINNIENKLANLGDDLAFKAYLPRKEFDSTVVEMNSNPINTKGMITKVYKKDGSLKCSSVTDSIDLGDTPYEEYLSRWYIHNNQGPQRSIFMMVYYKNQISTPGDGITASINIAPYNERVIKSAWTSRKLYTSQ